MWVNREDQTYACLIIIIIIMSFRPTPAKLLGDPVFESISCQYTPYQSPVRLFAASPRCAHLQLPEDISELCKGSAAQISLWKKFNDYKKVNSKSNVNDDTAVLCRWWRELPGRESHRWGVSPVVFGRRRPGERADQSRDHPVKTSHLHPSQVLAHLWPESA